MEKATISINEKERLAELYKYELLETHTEEVFDNLTKLAAQICNMPICLISLIDESRQWFKSKHGLSTNETPRDISFCGHAIHEPDSLFYIEDATKDKRFFDNPLVTGDPHVIFYAGSPLVSKNGHSLGTLCVIDHKPNSLNEFQKESLKLLSKQFIYLIESRILQKNRQTHYAFLTKISENLPGFIYTYQRYPDGKSCFPYSSHYIEDIYEVSSEEVKQDASIVFSRIHPDDIPLVAETILKSKETMSKWECDYRVNLPTKGQKYLRGTANPELINDGSILWHGYISDITELKKSEEVANQNAKMASLGEMAAGIAHEINNPLTIIKTSAAQLNTQITNNEFDLEKMSRNLSKINSTVDRISKIIKGLKYFSSPIQSEKFKNENMIDIIGETMSMCEEKFKVNNIPLKFTKNVDEATVECRGVEISQVVLNLLNNAFDAIEFLDEKWVHIDLLCSVNQIKISVTDSGFGIKKENVDKILKPFFTSKAAGKGTGLGLSISQKIIQSHNGEFWIDSDCINTRFCFQFPVKHTS
jgi:signal transduction histidine kinase